MAGRRHDSPEPRPDPPNEDGTGHPWFRPFSRRIIITILCVFWIGFEIMIQAHAVWLALAVGVSIYAVHYFFFAGHYANSFSETDP